MELFKEILINELSNENIEVKFPDINIIPENIISNICYESLYKIRSIINDTSLSDEECFIKIDEIINVLDGIGVYTGIRNDFL